MTVANLNLGRQRFVVVPRRDFDRLQRESARLHQLMQEDAALGKLAEKELRNFKKSGSKGIPWEKVKQDLGL